MRQGFKDPMPQANNINNRSREQVIQAPREHAQWVSSFLETWKDHKSSEMGSKETCDQGTLKRVVQVTLEP